MPAASYEIEPLLTPLSDEEPCGPDLEYDPDFQSLERAGAGTPERQYGEKVFPAEPPDWPQVHELALGLAARTRDLRVAVWLARSGARLFGLPGAWLGLQLLQGLVEQRWDFAHPQLDASDNNDPTMRLNALTPLAAPEALLADLRAASIVARRGSLTLRELELGLGRDDPHGDETSPTEAGVLQGLAGLTSDQPEAATALQGCADAAAAIVAAVESQVGSAAPDLSAFTRLLDTGPVALARMAPDAGNGAGGDDAGSESGGGGGGGFAVGGGGSIRNRADVVRELERVCEWLERNEPSHPAPLLLRRAQRLMNMSFMEIMQDMAPGGIDQVQTIAGPQPEQSSY
jgi:type VI secretion system protein ImpA